MMRANTQLLALCLGVATLGAAACNEDDPALAMPALHDVVDAPAPIRRAAEAVVRIGTQVSWGSGAFISAHGLLLTNNHVLGATVCPREGCWVQLTLQHQRGAERQDPVTLYAVPQHVDVGLDMAVLQLYRGDDAYEEFETPSYLTFEERDAAELIGTHVTIVGHPNGRLKKWSDGVVLDGYGAWFEATNYILPGDSGSPVLNDAGNIVGLIHRSSIDDGQFTARGVQTQSLGSASAPLVAALEAPLPPVVMSVEAEVTSEEALRYELAYLTGRTPFARIDGADVPLLSLLADACDAGLAREDIATLDELGEALAPCFAGESWIECRSDLEHDEVDPATVCPSESEREAWALRYQQVHQRWRAFTGELVLGPISYGISSLSLSTSEGSDAAVASLESALSAAHSILDFEVASWLASFAMHTDDVMQLINHYGAVRHYEVDARDIAIAALALTNNGDMTAARLWQIYGELKDDPDVDMSARLYIEEVEYNSGRL